MLLATWILTIVLLWASFACVVSLLIMIGIQHVRPEGQTTDPPQERRP